MGAKPLKDENAVLKKAFEILPNEHHENFLKAIAELEDNECHRTRTFPHTNLHKAKGVKQNVYRAYIHKTSGWRLHLQYGEGNFIELSDILEGQEHDNVQDVIKNRKGKYK